MKKTIHFCLAIIFGVVAFDVTAQAQISLTGAPYTQNFDSMGATGTTTPTGWFVGSFANAANLPPANGAISSTGVVAGIGSASTGTNYNFGITNMSERALGSVASAGIQRNTEVRFVNNTGGFITSFNASYTGEQWRNGGNASLAAQTNFMQYSADGVNFVNMGSSFDFVSPNQASATAAALDGNASGNRTTGLGGTYTPGAAVPPGATFYLRWADIDNTGNDHALAVDDFSISTTTTAAQYWDTNADSAGIGGTGDWDLASLNWNPLSDGTGTTAAYDSSKPASFGGTGAAVQVDPAGITASASLRFDANSYVIQGGALTLATVNGISVTSSVTATINSTVSGSIGLTKDGAGTLALGGANNFTGPVTVASGTLEVGGGSAIPDDSAVTLVGSTLRLNASEAIGSLPGIGRVELNANTLTISNTTDFQFSGTATNSGGITKQGSGVWTNNSATHNYTGNTRVEEGRVVIPINTATFGASNGTVVFAGGDMEWRTSRTLDNPVLIQSNVTFYGNFPSGATAVFGVFGGAQGTNSFTTATGTEIITLQNLNLTNFSFRLRQVGLLLTNPIVIGMPGDAGSSYLRCDSSTNALVGPIPATDQILSGNISGTGVFERNNNFANYGFKTILTGNNTFQGGIDLKGGFIGVGSDTALSTNNINIGYDPAHLGLFALGASRVITNNIVFRSDYSASATNLHIGGSEALTLSNITLNALNSQRLTVSNAAITTVAGVISGATGIEKTGSGTLVFSGANLYTGATVINAGKLLVNNSTGSGAGSGNVTVASGATFGGSGGISGTVTLNTGATIAAGASVGSLETGSQTWGPGATNVVEVSDATAGEGVGWDIIDITGGLTINATSVSPFVLDISGLTPANFDNTQSYQWRIVKTTTGISGFAANKFIILTNNFAPLGSGQFQVTSDNNNLFLQFVVPPAIAVNPEGQSVAAGSNVTFSVSASGGSLTYQWKKDGVDIEGATSSSYTIDPVRGTNYGDYTVVVSNSSGSQTSSIATLVVGPDITSQPPASQTVNSGNNASISVSATGSPTLIYQWKKGLANVVDDAVISGSTSATLLFTGIRSSDEGSYSVVITNSAGSVESSSSTLLIENSPVVTLQPDSQTVGAGTNVVFTTTSTGSEPLTYQWMRSNTNLSDGGNISGATTANLTITAVQPSDAATYSLLVSNSLGSTNSEPATLTVIEPPVITTQPVSQTNLAGSTASFSAVVSGTSPVFQWKKNGVSLVDGGDISGSTTTTLMIANVALDDAGNYTLVATNLAGTATSDVATLTVNEAPAITGQPQSQSVASGANATFTVTATGSPLNYQWSKNGVVISGATDSSYTVVASSSSIGSYSVVVSNELGTATSDSANLTINSQNLLFDNFDSYADQAAFEAVWPKITANSGALTTSTSLSAPNSISIDLTGTQRNGRSFTEAGIPASNNVITFSFDYYDSNAASAPYRQYANLQDGSPSAYGQLVSMGLNNNHSTLTDGGNYYMARILSVAVGTNAASAYFKLNDVGAPLRSTGWHNLKVVISNTEFKFYVDGILSKTVPNAGTLRSYDNVRLGSGLTSTVAANYDNFSVSRTAPQLSITAQPQNVTTNAGSTVTFSVTAPGATVYQWKKDGTDIVGATNSTLTLTNVLDADEGSYSVYLENGFSTTNSASATLTVIDPAINTQPQTITTNTLQSVTFTVGAGGTGTLLYQWNKDGNILSGATDSSYNIASTTTNDSGGYQVVVTGTSGSVTSVVATLTVDLTAQTITFAALADKVVGDPDFGVSATASSGLPVTFTSLTPSVVTVSGTNVSIVGAGTATIRASQAGDANYSAAPDVDRSFTVSAVIEEPTSFTSTAAGQGSFIGTPNATYTVQYADTLGEPTVWQTLMSVTTDGAGVGTFIDPTDPATRDERYYRISVP